MRASAAGTAQIAFRPFEWLCIQAGRCIAPGSADRRLSLPAKEYIGPENQNATSRLPSLSRAKLISVLSGTGL